MMVLSCGEGRRGEEGGQRTRQREGGMVATCAGGNLEPINLGNFYDKKHTRHNGPIWLAVRRTIVSASSL